MIGNFYIDGINAYETYKAFIKENSFKNLVEYPQFKEIDITEWLDQDGVDADLSDPVLDNKEFTLTFISSETGFFNFMAYLTETVYHDFYIPALDKTFKLRAIKQNSNIINCFHEYEVLFSDDFPMNGYTYEAPIPLSIETQYKIDDVDLSNYGIQILDGSIDSIFFQPEIKEHVISDIPTTKGILYGSQKLEFVPIGDPSPDTILPDNHFKSKEGKLNCLLKCSDISTFWKNYNALIYNLIQSGERTFTTESVFVEIPFYYGGVTVNNFFISQGSVWCDFSLTLMQTNYKISKIIELLASEDEYLILTEDNIYIEV